MKGDIKVIDQLNKLLAGELTAMDQYFIHSRMYENWGFNKLYERINHEMQDETSHADALIKRILFLEGVPDLSKRAPLAVGSNVPEMLKNDLELELRRCNKIKLSFSERFDKLSAWTMPRSRNVLKNSSRISTNGYGA